MKRLFISIDLPEKIQREIAGMGQSLPGARTVPREQLHLTLKFIGEVEGSRLLDIGEALEHIRLPRFSLALQGMGTFPPRGTPRVLWAGVEPRGPNPEGLISLRNSIEKQLSAIKIPRDKKKYRPHLTLARLNNTPIKRLQQYLAGNAFLQTSEFMVESFQLYSSLLTPKGAAHTVQRSYQLLDG